MSNRDPRKNTSRSSRDNSARRSTSSSRNSRTGKKNQGIGGAILARPQILFILAGIILLAIILIAILDRKPKAVADVQSVGGSPSSFTNSVLSESSGTGGGAVVSVVAENSSAQITDTTLSSADAGSAVSEAGTPSKMEVTGGGKTSTDAENNGEFSLSPGDHLVFANTRLVANLQTTEEKQAEEEAILTAQYEDKDQPVIITANVDGNQSMISLQSRIQAAKLYNDETVGWIRVRGTAINFAVVQNKGNNGYYQDLGYDKKYSHHIWGSGVRKYGDYGVIWASFESNLNSKEELSDNTVLFGHNWENISANPRMSSDGDIMLEHIAGYAHTEYARENPYIQFSIDGEEMTWVVVSAFYTEDYWKNRTKGVDFDYIDPTFTDAQKLVFISEIEKRSQFTTDDVMGVEDHFLTISTCTRAKGSRADQRFVVVARLVRDGEEPPELNYQDNPAIKSPVFK